MNADFCLFTPLPEGALAGTCHFERKAASKHLAVTRALADIAGRAGGAQLAAD